MDNRAIPFYLLGYEKAWDETYDVCVSIRAIMDSYDFEKLHQHEKHDMVMIPQEYYDWISSSIVLSKEDYHKLCEAAAVLEDDGK